jgi:hypothetical protein
MTRAREPDAERSALRPPDRVDHASRPAQVAPAATFHQAPAALRRLQRAAGNAAVSRLIHDHRPPARVQRVRVDLVSGGAVGDDPATNHREGVEFALDKMLVLWGIDMGMFGEIRPKVAALPAGEKVTDPDVLAKLQIALKRLSEPVLPAPVAQAQYATPLIGWVGEGQPNQPDDVHKVQDLLKLNGKLSDEDHKAESTVTGPYSAANIPKTFAGITALKQATVGGRGKVGWSPLIRSDEGGGEGPGGEDRLADQTFQFQEFMLFVPAGATSSLTNRVHIFFSAGGVVGAGSHVEHHGLRGSADQGARILIAVPGDEKKNTFSISEAQVRGALESAGRPATIASITLSAHSRGNANLARTLKARMLPSGLIERVTVLDGNDHAQALTTAFKASGIPMSKVTADIVNTGGKGSFGPKAHAVQLDPGTVRGIGYARLIKDAEALGRGAIPPAVAALASAVPLPPRGSFTAESPPATGKTDFNKFGRDNKAKLKAMLTGEVAGAKTVQDLAAKKDTSPYAFLEWENVLNISDRSSTDRRKWRVIQPAIYAHHLFVSELGGDFLM